jgi:hypothetical protein
MAFLQNTNILLGDEIYFGLMKSNNDLVGFNPITKK